MVDRQTDLRYIVIANLVLRLYHLRMKHCVMFDFDGVIVDSERYALELLMRMLSSEFSLDITEEDAMHVIGYNTARTIGYINERYGAAIDVDDFISRYPKYDNFYMDYPGIRPIDHAMECIGRLPSLGYKVGLVSSTRSLHILYALDRLRMVRLFDFIITGDMVSRSKPAPDPYLKGISFSGCQADECIVVEDSPAGVKAAKDAGIFAIGFKAASIRLDTSLADIEIGSYEELERYLERLVL